MVRKNTHSTWVISAIVLVTLVAISTWWWLQTLRSQNRQLSVKPEMAVSEIALEPLESKIGLHTRIPYRSLILAAEHATRTPQTGDGEKQTCKKVIGTKICATLQWQYSINRDGPVQIESQGERLQLKLPLSFEGVVSVDGRGGRLLGLRNKQFDGSLLLIADLDVSVERNWCPVINSTVNYEWRSDPKISLVGGLRINLRKSVDKALGRKLADLKSKLGNVINCDELRQSLQQQWRTHQLDVDIQADTQSRLFITPLNAAVSDIGMQADHISLAFELGATVELLQSVPDANDPTITHPSTLQASLQLPDLTPYSNTPGSVEFSLLVELPYQQLKSRIAEKIVGKRYQSGKSNSLVVTSVDLYPAGSLLIIDLGFEANALGSMIKTRGHVYVSTRPVADPINNQLILEDLQLTRTLDNKLMSALTTILKQQLLAALEKVAIIDLAPSLAKIETSVAEALSDTDKTAGINVQVQSPEVRLMALNPQARSLAAIVHLSTRLNATIPEDVLIR